MVSELAHEREMRRAHERITALVVESEDVDRVLGGLIELLVELGKGEVGVIRLRDGELLRSRAAVGLVDEVSSDFSTALEAAPALAPVPADDPARSEVMRGLGVESLVRVPLVHDTELVGIAYVGATSGAELVVTPTLQTIAIHVAGAVAHALSVDRLRHAVATRDTALGVVAHDLRNPIGVITMAVDNLVASVEDPAVLGPLERIRRSAERADRLVGDLLDVAAIEAGRLAIHSGKVEVASVVMSAMESQHQLAAKACVMLSTDLAPGLPFVVGDEHRLLEVLENLIGNAIKFTHAGDTVTVRATAGPSQVEISVKDSGRGIPPDELPYLFDRFWQANKADRRGSGLGLTICQGIVDAHGGRIWAESTIGIGTTVYFTVPALRARARARHDAAVANILLVDDRPANLLSLQAILERPDYRLVTAMSGPEALRYALRESFDLALIDVAMPEMDGFQVATQMKSLARTRDTPIIFVTAHGNDPTEVQRAYASGGADYLVKPLDAEIVRKKVAVFVELVRRVADVSAPPPG